MNREPPARADWLRQQERSNLAILRLMVWISLTLGRHVGRVVLYGIAAVLPGMRANKGGHIINLSSVAGLRVSAGVGTVYSATKFAVKAISEGLRAEVGREGIRVTTLYPGAVASELMDGSSDPEAAAGIKAFYQANEIPADSVARAVVYAIEQPAEMSINEITLRPTRQEF
mgnify:CR=1 FL=1